MESAEPRWGRLPNPATRLIGRDEDVAIVERLLQEHRLVTLTGAGGTGKTRVAIAVAARLADRHRDGARFVALQDARDRDAVTTAIAESLGVGERTRGSLDVSIEAFLAGRELLLVLDNFEQVLDAAPVVSRVLEVAPRVRVVVTSRAPLRIAGEQEQEVPPLDADAARRLFVARATEVRPSLDASAHGSAIAAIAARVDGLPLALELAAAQMRHLSPEMIQARLEASLPVLEGGHRDAPARQRTQRAALDWSHDLLAASTKRLFAALSVFAGGWTLEAAERVWGNGDGAGDTVYRALAELVEGSLVRARTDGPGVRYSMHQLTRDFAAERLAELPEHGMVQRRHAEWILDLVQEAEPHLVLRDLRTWQERLRTEEDNIRRSLRWAVEHGATEPGATELGLRIAGSLWRFWFHWAELREGITWLEAVLALPGAETPGEPRARALSSLAALRWHQGRFTESLQAYLEVISVLRSLGVEEERLGDALDDASWAADLGGETELAVRLIEEKWRYPRRPRSHLLDGWVDREIDLAFKRLGLRGPDPAAASVIAALEVILDDVDRSDQWLFAAHARATIGGLQQEHRVGDGGHRYGREALRRYRDLGHHGQIPIMLLWSARDELGRGRADRALRLVAATGPASELVGGMVVADRDPGGIADLHQRASARLPADEVARAIREGRAMSTDEAIAYALDETPDEAPTASGRTQRGGPFALTPREREVLALVADGRTDGEIAEALVISKKTASVHVASVKDKLGAGSRAEIVAMTLRSGHVDPPQR